LDDEAVNSKKRAFEEMESAYESGAFGGVSRFQGMIGFHCD